MKTNNKNVISMLMVTCLLLCISMFGILILTMNVIDSEVAPINQVEFEEEIEEEDQDDGEDDAGLAHEVIDAVVQEFADSAAEDLTGFVGGGEVDESK